jgi:hypothetical protein
LSGLSARTDGTSLAEKEALISQVWNFETFFSRRKEAAKGALKKGTS